MQFGTNVVGPYLLTRLLMPLLINAASQSGLARIVNTSSLGHMAIKGDPINWSTLRPDETSPNKDEWSEGEKLRRKLGPDQLYYQSKCVRARFPLRAHLCNADLDVCMKGNILVSNELARRFGDQNVISVAVHPGA